MERRVTPQDLRRHIHKLELATPLAVAFERDLAKTFPTLKNPWWSSQKEHWLGWLDEYNGPGYYGRSNWKVTAKAVYNRVGNPAMVLWLGEASGIPGARVKEAIEASELAGNSWRAKCGAIRRVIPWEDIEQNLFGRVRG